MFPQHNNRTLALDSMFLAFVHLPVAASFHAPHHSAVLSALEEGSQVPLLNTGEKGSETLSEQT